MAAYLQMIGGGLVALLAALYMVELTPNYEDGIVDLSNTQVVMIADCPRVFSYVGDLSKYAVWFPGIQDMTAVEPGPMETGKRFEETVNYPIYGNHVRLIYVLEYSPSKVLQFLYDDTSRVIVTLTTTQTTAERCLLDFKVGTKRTSYLYHIFAGIPLRIMYSLRGRHAMFAVRSMFNNQGGSGF